MMRTARTSVLSDILLHTGMKWDLGHIILDKAILAPPAKHTI